MSGFTHIYGDDPNRVSDLENPNTPKRGRQSSIDEFFNNLGGERRASAGERFVNEMIARDGATGEQKMDIDDDRLDENGFLKGGINPSNEFITSGPMPKFKLKKGIPWKRMFTYKRPNYNKPPRTTTPTQPAECSGSELHFVPKCCNSNTCAPKQSFTKTPATSNNNMVRGRLSWRGRKVLRSGYRAKNAARTTNAYRAAWLAKEANNENRPTLSLFGASMKDATEQQKYMRKVAGYKGKGDYRSVMKYLSRAGGALAGAASGGMSGGWGGAFAGAKTGWGQGADFSKWAGWGDYGPMSTNQIMDSGGGSQQNIGINQTSLSGDIYVEQSEFVANVVASAAGAGVSGFEIQAYDLNVGLNRTFPFLSQIAQNYQLYDLNGLIFQYKPTSGEGTGVSGNAIGKVIVATQYDPDADPFVNSVQMANYDWANSCKPSCGLLHGVETKESQTPTNMKYIRTGNTLTKSRLFTDYGRLFIATEGIPFTAAGQSVVGELWVTYSVRLSRANLYGALFGSSIQWSIYTWTGTAATLHPSVVVPQLPCPFTLDLAEVSNTECTVTFPVEVSVGAYMIICTISGVYAGVFLGSGGTEVNCVIGQFAIAAAPAPTQYISASGVGAATNQNCTLLQTVVVNAPGSTTASFNLVLSAALPADRVINLRAIQVPYNVAI